MPPPEQQNHTCSEQDAPGHARARGGGSNLKEKEEISSLKASPPAYMLITVESAVEAEG